LIRKRLKKETVDIEEVLHRNALEMKKAIDQEFTTLKKYEGKTGYKVQKTKTKERLKKKVDENEKKTLKEIRDVEDILK
jgi:hypothetical protein